mmetsp:Transcript_37094/g.96165  ORF Transcript_37094/g.96165 Transcript_37094/m.96165 type:complete len:226 (-) Transcript_37094:302-979(-)
MTNVRKKGITPFSLYGLDAGKGTQLLQHDERDEGVRSESQVIGEGTLVKSERTLILECLHHAVDHSGVVASGVHHSRLHHISGRGDNGNDNAGEHRAHNMKGKALFHPAILQDGMFSVVIGGKLGARSKASTSSVGHDTFEEAGNTTFTPDRGESSNRTSVSPLRTTLGISLHSDFDQIGWGGDNGANNTGRTTSEDLSPQLHIAALLSSREQSSEGLVRAKADG